MFEKQLKEKLKAIFKVKKVTFDHPSESKEQDCIFVKVENPRIRFKDGRATARVSGQILIQGNAENLPFGYLSKSYQESTKEEKKDIAFFNFEENETYYRNLVQRTAEFVYFFSTQYDPNVGTINEINVSIEEA